MSKSNKTGFTLIELLIVVAIIAILAAIAIPNFLAAQVRAKVSRAKGEMRTLATALESYYIDNNVYPEDLDYPWPWYITSGVTTPISYISNNQLIDPFRVFTFGSDPRGERYRYLNYDLEANGQWVTDWTGTAHPNATAVTAMDRYGKWRLSSCGPDRIAGNPPAAATWTFSTLNPYDPSNGTVSWGDIIRSQKNPDRQDPESFQ